MIKTLAGPQIEDELRNGLYVSADNQIRRQIVMTLKPSGPGLMMGSVINGKIDMNILDVHFLGETRSCPVGSLDNAVGQKCITSFDAH
jgi:hypothetical protein